MHAVHEEVPAPCLQRHLPEYLHRELVHLVRVLAAQEFPQPFLDVGDVLPAQLGFETLVPVVQEFLEGAPGPVENRGLLGGRGLAAEPGQGTPVPAGPFI